MESYGTSGRNLLRFRREESDVAFSSGAIRARDEGAQETVGLCVE